MGVHRRSRRGVAPLIGTVFLVALTLVLASVLYALRPPLPSSGFSLSWYATSAGSEPTRGDGSDCKNVNGVQTCLTLPSIQIVFPSPTPVPLSEILMVFYCNGTVYLAATLAEMAWVPGSPGTVGGQGPQLQHCGTYTPPMAAWDRFAFFDSLDPDSTTLQPGDSVIVYAHTFTTFKDDDFHGAPLWCYSVPDACTIDFVYTGSPPSLAATIPLLGLSG